MQRAPQDAGALTNPETPNATSIGSAAIQGSLLLKPTAHESHHRSSDRSRDGGGGVGEGEGVGDIYHQDSLTSRSSRSRYVYL